MKRYLAEQIHTSWLIAAFCAGIVLGVIAAPSLPHDFFASWSWLVAGGLVALFSLMIHRRWLVTMMIIAGGLVGLWRASAMLISTDNYAPLYGTTVLLAGRVMEDPDIDKSNHTLLRLSDIQIDGAQPRRAGAVWVSTAKTAAVKRGDVVTVRGSLSQGFGAFVGAMYWAEIVRVERPQPGDVAVKVRDWFAERVRRYMPETESALGLGFLLGLRRALPLDLMLALQIAGLTHVIVASGYNLTILVRMARRVFGRFSKYFAALASLIMIIMFIGITGLSPSMTRAGLIAGISLAAWYYGRAVHPFVLIPFVAAITLLFNPSYGWGDIGWQLSFASFGGVVILAPLLTRYFFGPARPRLLMQIMIETFSAQVMTLPILMHSFGMVSTVSLAANMLILPLIPLAMLLVFLIGIFASVPFVASLIAIPTSWLLSYMVFAATTLASQSWAQITVVVSGAAVLVIYALIFLWMYHMKRATNYRLLAVNIVE